MTATPPDPFATQHGSTTDPDSQAPVDEQTLRLREENRALRELLAAQAQAANPSQEPGPFRRLCWWLISAPGAALVGWRSLLGHDTARPITGKRVGYATLTVLYTLAIYGALVLLVVSWSSPNTPLSGSAAAGPVRVPLTPLPDNGTNAPVSEASPEAPPSVEPGTDAGAEPEPETVSSEAQLPVPAAASAVPIMHSSEHAAAPGSPALALQPPVAEPHSTLRMTEIPAQDPLAWLDALRGELALCAELGFFERPDCAWAARRQYCEPNRAWGMVKECPTRP
ncbi:hypothetical protein JL37_17825 [Achromobacter sp. RTa]|uniref:hypothetical protein n=1 Tax=Achromobacter sp. RTa TaxID=1532557 RepID=UPI00050DD857|nr:hypothetical protein [Achromobacter sp. RTa]KGD92501.1 hypothetical protein JL37_17825 [Achromobacter sp. RTa]